MYNMDFVGLFRLPAILHIDSPVARQLARKKGVDRIKHMDMKLLWAQETLSKGAYILKKGPRIVNVVEMITHPLPSSDSSELKTFLPRRWSASWVRWISWRLC